MVTNKEFNFTGVYKLVNIKTNKFYIGSGGGKRGIYQRVRNHISGFNTGKSHCLKLLNSMKKHGIENFYLIVLEKCLKEECQQKEQYWLDLLNPEYNILKNAYSPKGRIISQETRDKIGKAHKGKIITEKHKEQIRKASLGRKLSEETKKKISESHLGEKNYWYGKVHSENAKNKISIANLGKKLSEETKKKMSKSRIGHKTSEETKEKIRQSNLGKIRSQETRNKISLVKKSKSKKIINLTSYEIYNNIYEASEVLKLHIQSLHRILSGKRPKSKIKVKWIIEQDKQKLL